MIGYPNLLHGCDFLRFLFYELLMSLRRVQQTYSTVTGTVIRVTGFIDSPVLLIVHDCTI